MLGIGVLIFAVCALAIVSWFELSILKQRFRSAAANELSRLPRWSRPRWSSGLTIRKTLPSRFSTAGSRAATGTITASCGAFGRRRSRPIWGRRSRGGPRKSRSMRSTSQALRTGQPVERFEGDTYRYSLPIVLGRNTGTQTEVSPAATRAEWDRERRGHRRVLHQHPGGGRVFRALPAALYHGRGDGAAAAAAILGIQFILGRVITRPLARMTEAMRGLAGGDETVQVPSQHRADEIGEMAGAVRVFKEHMSEANRLRAQHPPRFRIVRGAVRGGPSCSRERAFHARRVVNPRVARGTGGGTPWSVVCKKYCRAPSRPSNSRPTQRPWSPGRRPCTTRATVASASDHHVLRGNRNATSSASPVMTGFSAKTSIPKGERSRPHLPTSAKSRFPDDLAVDANTAAKRTALLGGYERGGHEGLLQTIRPPQADAGRRSRIVGGPAPRGQFRANFAQPSAPPTPPPINIAKSSSPSRSCTSLDSSGMRTTAPCLGRVPRRRTDVHRVESARRTASACASHQARRYHPRRARVRGRRRRSRPPPRLEQRQPRGEEGGIDSRRTPRAAFATLRVDR